jgi:molybdopterin converting factor small subunit
MIFGKKDKPKEAAKEPPRQVVSTTAARAHLECTAGPEKGQTFRCAPAATVVGRDASCDVVLTETVISRQHCRIDRQPDGWVLKNLSSNGTLVNRKPADEVPLADNDEIRLGAKTRLRFVVEAVATFTSGRPQFRARATGQEDEQADGEQEQAAAEAKVSLFKRRKGLFIGLGAYLVIVVVIAAALAFRNTTATSGDEVAVLGMEDTITLLPGGETLRVLRTETDGYYCEDPSLGTHRLIPFADVNSGKAVARRGIRKSLDVRFELKSARPGYAYTIEERNEGLGELCKKQARENYALSKLPGKEAYLFGAVRTFQKSLAYYGGRTAFVDDPAAERVRQDSLKELLDKVKDTYDAAIFYEKSGDPRKAYKNYDLLTRLVPERDNPIHENVSKRISALKAKYKDIKF